MSLGLRLILTILSSGPFSLSRFLARAQHSTVNADYRFVSQVLGISYRVAANTRAQYISYLRSKSGSLALYR